METSNEMLMYWVVLVLGIAIGTIYGIWLSDYYMKEEAEKKVKNDIDKKLHEISVEYRVTPNDLVKSVQARGFERMGLDEQSHQMRSSIGKDNRSLDLAAIEMEKFIKETKKKAPLGKGAVVNITG